MAHSSITWSDATFWSIKEVEGVKGHALAATKLDVAGSSFSTAHCFRLSLWSLELHEPAKRQ